MTEKREVYVALCERLHYPPSDYLIRILEKMLTEDDGILLLELPIQPHDLAQKTNLDEEEVKKKLDEFLQRGLVVSTKKGPQLVREVTQLHDASLASADSVRVPSSEILPEEDMKEIIIKAESIAVVPCPCRKPLRRCDAPLEVCMQFNKWADYAVDRGAGKKVSAEQAL